MKDEKSDSLALPKKADNLNEWYVEVVERAELSDKRYPIKGMNVWLPYGWNIMQRIDGLIREEMMRTEHKEVYFPLLIPEEQFRKEAEHITGFYGEVYWVTRAGENELDVPMLLRPTSETAMYPVFSLWIRSHTDLPLKVFQIVNTFRYETKQTRSFMRVREIHFFEAHTCHTTFEDAERQIAEDIEILQNLFRKLCLHYVLCKRPDWDKFAGAHYSIGIDSVMPNGRTLQLGSIHQYKTNFSVPYNIKYEDEKGEHKFVHQTTYGMSERLLGAVIIVHGDDRGLVLPPIIAPIQVVIVPILKKEIREPIIDACRKIESALGAEGIRVKCDMRDLRPGNKYYYWEMRGVPLRIEIGPRDLEKNVVTLVRRDTLRRYEVLYTQLLKEVKHIMEDMALSLLRRAEEMQKDHIQEVNDLRNVKEGKIARMYWCGNEECGHEIEDVTGWSILGNPVNEKHPLGKCIVCGAESSDVIYVSKTY